MISKGKSSLAFLIVLTAFIACACSMQGESAQGETYKVYYVNRDETAVFSVDYATTARDKEELVAELLEQLGTSSEKLEYKAPLSDSFQLLGYSIAEDQLVISFDENYKKLPVPRKCWSARQLSAL